MTVGSSDVLVTIKSEPTLYYVTIRRNSGSQTTAQVYASTYYYVFNNVTSSSNNYVHFVGLLPDSDQDRDLFVARDDVSSDINSFTIRLYNHFVLFSLS